MPKISERLIFALIATMCVILGLLIFYRPELHVLRNHVGDILATLAVYSCLAIFLKRIGVVCGLTLTLSIGIEFLQSFPLVSHESQLTRLFLGQTFDPIDLTIYVITTITITSVHRYARNLH